MAAITSIIAALAQFAKELMSYINNKFLVDLGRHDAELEHLKQLDEIQGALDAIANSKSPDDTDAILSKL